MGELIRLDIGCGGNKQPGFIGLDKRQLPGVDIVHDVEVFPWPLDDESVALAISSHLIEHIKPWLSIDFMNEIWRVLIPGGTLALALPYAGSPGYWQDPTHCNGCTEVTFQYFDRRQFLYSIYKPSPWEIKDGFPVWQVNGNLEVIMEKVTDTVSVGLADLGISVGDSVQTGEAIS